MAHDDGSLVPGLGRLVSTLQFDPGDGALVDLPTTISSRIGLTGHTRGRFRMAPGSWADRQGSLHWGDADIAFSIDPQGRLAGATGSIARVQLAAGDGTLAIGPLSLHVDRAPTRYGFMTGTVEFASDSIATGDAEISGFRVDAASALQGDTVQGSLLLEIGRAAAPAFGQAGLSMSLRYRGLDAASVAALRAAVRQGLAQEGIAGMLAALSPDATPQLQLLLAAGGHLDIDRLVIGLPQGDITAGAQLTVAAGDGDDFSWPGALLRTTASMSLRVPVATYRAIVAAEPQANAALAAGFLARDGNDYTMQIEVANGMARVNGAPVPLAALLQGR
jgi:hypothetical protein